MRLAIGPLLFDWGKSETEAFYHRMAFETDADILYIGEVVCSKRNPFTPEGLIGLATALRASGKEIVLSTYGLVMNEPELETIRQIVRLAGEAGLMVEVNDLGGLAIAEGRPMVAGPHITTYNAETRAILQSVGVRRVVMPVELPKDHMGAILRERGVGSERVEGEAFVYGRLPLSFSARCYTARAFHLPKSNCQFKCGGFPDGMPVTTQDGERFLILNGVQTMSHPVYNLVEAVETLTEVGLDIVRLSPQSQNMLEIIQIWKDRLAGRMDGPAALARLQALHPDIVFCNGYFYGQSGKCYV